MQQLSNDVNTFIYVKLEKEQNKLFNYLSQYLTLATTVEKK